MCDLGDFGGIADGAPFAVFHEIRTDKAHLGSKCLTALHTGNHLGISHRIHRSLYDGRKADPLPPVSDTLVIFRRAIGAGMVVGRMQQDMLHRHTGSLTDQGTNIGRKVAVDIADIHADDQCLCLSLLQIHSGDADIVKNRLTGLAAVHTNGFIGIKNLPAIANFKVLHKNSS
jgi:hypothetical protein